MSPAQDSVMAGAPIGNDTELAIMPIARETANNESHTLGDAENALSPPVVEHPHRTKLRTFTVMVALCVSTIYLIHYQPTEAKSLRL